MSILFKNKIIFGFTLFLIFSLTIPGNAEVEAPKKQLKNGIPIEDITCKVGLNLIIRNRSCITRCSKRCCVECTAK